MAGTIPFVSEPTLASGLAGMGLVETVEASVLILRAAERDRLRLEGLERRWLAVEALGRVQPSTLAVESARVLDLACGGEILDFLGRAMLFLFVAVVHVGMYTALEETAKERR